jgi:hypothetical protein
MTPPPKKQTNEQKRENGAAQIFLIFALIALIGAASLAIDAGAIYVGRTQMQNASDAAALAAAVNMVDRTGPTLTLSAGETAAVSVANSNQSIDNANISLDTADITWGSWDLTTRTFTPATDLTDLDQVTSVEVRTRMDGASNGPVPAMMSRVLGRSSFDVTADAVALLGFAGSAPIGTVDLPIAIDCCELRGSPNCDQDYCATIATPPNACTLDSPQGGGSPSTVSCIEFASTPEQNACWTVFDDSSASTNTADLTDIVANGNPIEVSVNDSFYLDNGTKTPVISDIFDRMQGDGAFSGSPSGQDYYPPFDGTMDSWVVALPVVECQDTDECAGGSPAQMVGVVCFEVREVIVTPDKIIKGTFMCPGHPRFQECDLGSTGGGSNFGVIATRPVLVR